MTRAVITVQTPAHAGAELTWTAGDTANGAEFTNTGKERLIVRNAHASDARTIGIPSGGTVDGAAIADISQAIDAGDVWSFGPFMKFIYDQPATDLVYINFPANGSDLKLALIQE